MQMTPVFLIGLAIMLVCAANFSPSRIPRTGSLHIKVWQKIFGIVGFILTLLIVLNPELLALGLLGDAALFDILVLALSVQVQVVVFRAWGCIHQVFSKTISFLHPSFQRDLLTLAYTLNCLRDFARKTRKATYRILRGPHTMAC